MEKKKEYFVIKNVFGKIITGERQQFLVFEYPKQAEKYIDKKLGSSNSLKIVKFNKK